MSAHNILAELAAAMQRNHGDLASGTALEGGSNGLWSIVTTGAETATLAAPEKEGQIVCFLLHTDGGDMVITIADTVNQSGNNTLTFADADDLIVLMSFPSADGFQWRVLLNDGVALSTV